MSSIFALPSWLLIRISRPLLSSSHIWKHRRFGLKEWANGRTQLTREFDFVLWFYFLSLVAVLIRIFVFVLKGWGLTS